MSEHWVYGAIGFLLALHVLAMIRAYQKNEGGNDGTVAEEYVSSQGVECPQCGAVNSEGYRYCHQCVAELPGEGSVLGTSTYPDTRRTL